MSEVTTVEAEEQEKAKPARRKPKQKSYFLTTKLNRYYFDDEESYVEHRPLDEGLYEAFQDITSTIKVDRDGESTEVDMALGKTRRFLLETLVTGWNLVDEEDNPVEFSQKRLTELPPHIITGLVEDIYKSNAILRGDDEEGK